ncbi:hypothetical protein GCM10023334_040080 [Nonomuraea thailandensis]
MPEELRFRILGPVRGWLGDEELVLGPVKQRTVLAALLIAGGEPVPAYSLRGCLWDAPPANAAGLIQTYVSRLRAVVGRSTLLFDTGGYRLDIRPDQVDLLRFRSLRRQGGEVEADPAAVLAAAFAEVKGRPCEDLREAMRSHPLLMDVERELREAAIEYADCAQVDRAGEVARLLEWISLTAPLDERLFSRLIRTYALIGQQADALAAYARIRGRLRDELGVGPGQELSAAYHDTLAQSSLRHRPTSAARARRPVLVRRETDLSAIRKDLVRHRAVTVVGPPGVGKTAVARALLADDAAGADGDCRESFVSADGEGGIFVALADLPRERGDGRGSAEALAQAVLAALEGPGVLQYPVAALIRQLRERPLLLVMDAAEHLPLGCGGIVAKIAHRCPGTRVLVTSRRPLGYPGENVHEIRTLEVPPPNEVVDHAASFPAMELFLAVAGRSTGEVDLSGAARLCRELDGLPLALRLAASWPVSARLSGAVDLALAGLTASVSRGLDLLTGEQQSLFTQLATLDGEFSLDEAERFAGELGLGAADGAMLLADLVDHSLVQRAHGSEHRFRILRPIRRVARMYLTKDS